MEEQKTYDSIVAAKYLIALAKEKGQELNVTKLQKLLYISYGILLAKHGRRAIAESPQAWPFGPVFPRTQKRFDKISQATLVDEDLAEISGDKTVTDVFNQVIDSYSFFSAGKLSAWSHMPGSPWDKTVKQNGFQWSVQIPDELIIEYFKQLTL